MQDVAQMEYNQEGYLLIGLLGDQKFVKGRIKVVGVRRRSKVGKLLIGSTAQHVILNAPCPVVSIK